MKSIYLQLKSPWYAIFIATLIVYSGCRRESVTDSVISQSDHALIPMSAGIITNRSGGRFISYGFYLIPSSSHGDRNNYLLTLENTSSKSIDMSGVKRDSFSLQDLHGKSVGLVLQSVPRDIIYGEMTSVHLAAIDSKNLSYPLALTFQTTLGDIPVYLCITNIGNRTRQP